MPIVGVTIDFQSRRMRNNLDRLKRQFPKETMDDIETARDEAYREIGRRMSGPVLKVRTGRLRSSRRKVDRGSGSKRTFSVTTNVPYGRYQEVGFRHIWSGKRVRNPIWLPVWRWAEDRLAKRLDRTQRRLLKGR